ncbi:glycoside hydrolase family 2 protein [Gonapodya prolifera JEL478]|uniref:beta-mannosidase n=1 Tax=Gonapodya prolifera (strain JEL478) TaxID=1344416 RepID=A0A139A2W4_GONPJ|nr:glycoside hydrolase family 2 protein [Gonapodya prolifera JEL478]|eukprot:KXS11126.1 glycoside hydrolase family 2 protein [Gonapodya prolifera JEL478]
MKLTGDWQIHGHDRRGRPLTIDGQIPGEIYPQLHRAFVLSDSPLRGDDFATGALDWVHKQDWTYEKTFTVDRGGQDGGEEGVEGARILDSRKVLLVFHGLDTLAAISLNGHPVGKADNAFRPWTFDIRPLLREGENTLRVVLYSVTAGPAVASVSSSPQSWIRKPLASFGVPHFPAFPGCGITGDVELIPLVDTVWMSDLAVRVCKNGDQSRFAAIKSDWLVEVTMDLIANEPRSDLAVFVSLNIPGSASPPHIEMCNVNTGFENVTISVPLVVAKDSVETWDYADGIGDQRLYELTVAVMDQSRGIALQRQKRNIGFRNITVKTHPSKEILTCTFFIEENLIFLKGAAVSPIELFPTTVTFDQLDYMTESCTAANLNAIYVPGTTGFLSDRFYDLCDQRGLLVLQECAFDDRVQYAQNLNMKSVEEEIRYQIRRLMHHPSVIAWIANVEDQRILSAIEKSAKLLDPSRPLLRCSSSPKSQETLALLGDGIPSLPATDILKQAIDFTDLSPLSEVMKARSLVVPMEAALQNVKSALPSEVRTCIHDLGNDHGPKSSEEITSSISYLTQCLQALELKSEIEQRRRSHKCTGFVYRSLNDPWQAPYPGSLEYGGRWKLSHHVISNLLRPVLVSCQADTVDEMEIFLSSALLDALGVHVLVRIYSLRDSKLKWTKQFDSVPIQPMSTILLFRGGVTGTNKNPDDLSLKEHVIDMEARDSGSGRLLSSNWHVVGENRLPSSIFNKRPSLDIKVTGVSQYTSAVWDSTGRERSRVDLVITTDSVVPFFNLDNSRYRGWYDLGCTVLIPGQTYHVSFYPWPGENGGLKASAVGASEVQASRKAGGRDRLLQLLASKKRSDSSAGRDTRLPEASQQWSIVSAHDFVASTVQVQTLAGSYAVLLQAVNDKTASSTGFNRFKAPTYRAPNTQESSKKYIWTTNVEDEDAGGSSSRRGPQDSPH